jgi:hypothetical protein
LTRYTHVVVILSLVLTFAMSACGASSPRLVVGAPPDVWQPSPPGQGFASGPAGAIAVKFIEFTPLQFRVYYVFKLSSQAASQTSPVTLRVTASSSLSASPSTPVVPLTSAIQTLGQIGDYTIGVMHIKHLNRAGQVITLAITPALPGAATWHLSPIHQLIYQTHADTATGAAGGYPDALSEAQWYGPVQAQLVSYVKVVIPGQPIADRTYVFVRSDDWVNVQAITKAQYIALAGTGNFTP